MKRFGNLFTTICSMDNLLLADMKARRQKGRQKGIREFDKDRGANLMKLHHELVGKTYRTPAYKVFPIYEPKERIISMLPYKDRIVHHAIMNVLERIFVATFTADSYSCVKGKGTHKADKAVKRAVKDRRGTQYGVKMDVRKFYPSVDGSILKQLIRRKIKDADLLELLDGIIDSATGIPIGNYLSQYFANLYLTGFDHWIKEVKRVKYYFRYADDMVILAATKAELHQLRHDIQTYLKDHLRLELKDNYQVFPISARGMDFVGYINYHTHSRVRKRTKQRCARKLKRNCSPSTVASYKGCFKHADCRHLTKKLFSIENIQRPGHTTRNTALRRRKNKGSTDTERKDRNPCIQN